MIRIVLIHNLLIQEDIIFEKDCICLVVLILRIYLEKQIPGVIFPGGIIQSSMRATLRAPWLIKPSSWRGARGQGGGQYNRPLKGAHLSRAGADRPRPVS